MKICIYGAGAMAIAETFSVKFRVDVDRRIEGARKVGAHKTSMPQDLERGRPMEIDPLVTVVQEMGRLTKFRRRHSTRCWRWLRSAPGSPGSMTEMSVLRKQNQATIPMLSRAILNNHGIRIHMDSIS